MGAQRADEVDRVLRALADGNRREILRVIRSEPHAVGAVAEQLGLSQQTTSHHLRVLQEAGLAECRRTGTRHLYLVRSEGLSAVRSYLDDFWPARLTALKGAVESASGASPSASGAGRSPKGVASDG